jgi:hypothetical protein
VHKEPENSFYLLVVNYLIHNSSIKIGMSSLLGKYAARNNLLNSIKPIVSNGSNPEQLNEFFDEDDGS